jgi:predicted nuclease of restriction endonuclease-like RecB superfamily
MPRRVRPTRTVVGTKYRSNFEVDFASDLIKRGLDFSYEPDSYSYVPRTTTYTPDFYLPEYKFYIETKGFFTSEDRTKHLTFRDQHPNIDIRFVFSNAENKLTKSGKTTYAQWCKRNGFLYSNRIIDETWLIKEDQEDAKED